MPVATDENPTPPQSPNPRVHVTPPQFYPSFNLAGDEHLDDPNATPTAKPSPLLFFLPPSPSSELPPPITDIKAAPRPPMGRKTTSESSLAARRAASGKLPNKALISLQQMRFESPHASLGLGVGPGSAGFEGMEGISPGLQTNSSTALRAALGLGFDDAKEAKSSSRPSTPTDENSGSPRLGSPSVLRSPSRRRSPLPRSPGSTLRDDPFSTSPEVKIPPSLRGSKILDKLNLSPQTLNSPLSPTRERPNAYVAPPSPLIRTSAFSYSNTGPLTPLTPSHVPGAPTLSGGGQFDWFSYSMPDSPGCPLPPQKIEFANEAVSKQGYFLHTPSSASDRRYGNHHPLPASPLGTGRFGSSNSNPFFTP